MIAKKILNLLSRKEAKKDDKLLPFLDINESDLQIYCKRLFDAFAFQLKMKYKRDLALFVQIDNGSKSGIRYKIKKKAEGTVKGFPDVMILATRLDNSQQKTFFVEFKKLSSYKITEEQLEMQQILNLMGYEAYTTNNPIFFEKHILLDRIQNFILGNDI